MSEAAIGGEQIPRVNQHGNGQRQNVVGGIPVVSHSPRVLRAGENVREGVVEGRARHPNEQYQGNPPSQGAYNVAAGVGREAGHNSDTDSLSPQAPFDPNLICPFCRLQYRIGEIQKYRKHVVYCTGMS